MEVDKKSTVAHVVDPLTLGGDFDLRMLKLSPEHLAQTDKSMNAALWQYSPLDSSGIPESPVFFKPNYKEGPPFDVSAYAEDAAREELRLLFLKTALFSSWWPYLTCHWEAAAQVAKRKATAQVEPLGVVVRNVTKKKQEVNKLFKSNKLRKALLGYMSCVYDLMPWSASPILLTAEQCYQSGLAQLEASLWNNIYITVLKGSDLPKDVRADGLLTCYAEVLKMRYVPAKALYKCINRFINLKEKHLFITTYRKPYDFALIKEAAEAMVDKESDEWAHKHCVTEHVCFKQEFREKVKAWEID